MFELIKRKKAIRIILFFCTILIILNYIYNTNSFNSRKTYLNDVDLILDAFHQAKTLETEIENRYQLTAIVLHWNSLTRVRKSIENIINSKLFKEIIVWNNNPNVTVSHNHVLINGTSPILIFIINSKENAKDHGKYRACSAAQTLACFYSDDDWSSFHYIKSLIASFRSDPTLLHSTTNDVTYYNNLLWSFMDTRINLHSGFSWIGCGSIFLREHAERHLQLLTTHISPSHPELLAFSDVFFSVWLNDMPTQMAVNLLVNPASANETIKSFSATENFDRLHVASAMLAIRKLEYSLRLNDTQSNSTFPRYSNRRLPYTTRSPSSNDDFIFFSNILPVDIVNMPFDITRDADRATYKVVPHGSNYTHFSQHNTLKAVDADKKTCWRPLGTVEKGDFFAIDFLRIQKDIAFAIIIGHSLQLQTTLDMRVSFDGVFWISHQSLKHSSIDNNDLPLKNFTRLTIDSTQFSSGLRSFRFIAFNGTSSFNEEFQVCDIQLLKKL